MRRLLIAAIAGFGLLMLGTVSANADDHEAGFTEAGPVDLAGHGDIPNVGEHVELGSVELGEGEWTITASVRLFVGDPADGKAADDQKNSQGCGMYADGEQVGGAGGSSSLWTSIEGGKDATFSEWWNGSEFQPEVVLDGPATVALECFIDASHSGVTEGDRQSMAATDIVIAAVRTVEDPEPEVCEFDASLTADDEACVEPEDDNDQTGTGTDEDSDNETAAVPTAVPAGAESLPNTGVSPMLLGAGGLTLLVAGGAMLRLRYRRPHGHYRSVA